MANFYKDNDDLQFYVERGVDWQTLVTLVEPSFDSPDAPKNVDEAVQSYKDMLEMIGGFVAEEVAPRVPQIDRDGVELKKNGEVVVSEGFAQVFEQMKELGLHGMVVPRELGGMNCPVMLYFMTCELLARADASIMTHFGFHGGIATTLLLYSATEGTTTYDEKTHTITDTRFKEAIEEIASGEAWGSMDITEPNAGSDMAAVSARGEQDADGNWFVTGQKIFITSGHGKWHLVVARTEPAPKGDDGIAGLQGLSLFLVPTYETDDTGKKKWLATIERVEEKIGHHGSVTATVSFDRTPAQLIGSRGDGFKNMLLLMNNARIGVGCESLGVCEAAYRLARDYAAERQSMGKTIDRHEIIADYLDEMRTDIQGIRALAFHAAFHEEVSHRLRLQSVFVSDDEVTERRRRKKMKIASAEARRLTPLIKFLAAERAVELSRRSIQIHGGVGYTKEYGAEKLLRDALVLPIYEGTSQIQALMAMKDTLSGILRNPQEFVKSIAQARWRSVSSRDPLERRVAKIQSISLAAQQHLVSKTAATKLKALTNQPVTEWPQAFRKNWDPKRDFAFALLHAERLTAILADAAVCDILLQQVKKFPERRDLLDRYLERAEPRCRHFHDVITSSGNRVLQQLNPELGASDDEANQSAGA